MVRLIIQTASVDPKDIVMRLYFICFLPFICNDNNDNDNYDDDHDDNV